MSAKKFNPKPDQITINGTSYELVAFYYPGHNTPWDNFYQAYFLGNFYQTNLTVTINGLTATFHTSEAAFQATKWWTYDNGSIRKQFENAPDGNTAFHISKNNKSTADYSYAGLGRDEAMLTVLTSKFSDPDLKQGLLDTGIAYLLEHNQKKGLDAYWSDDFDGTGDNTLGKTLMQLRANLGGAPSPCDTCKVLDFTLHVK